MNNAPSSSADLFKGLLSSAEDPAPAATTEPVTPVAAVEELEENDPPAPDELDMLKKRAKLMGISHSPNIGLEALRAKVKAKLDGETESQKEPETPVEQNTVQNQAAPAQSGFAQVSMAPVALTPLQQKIRDRKAMFDEQMRLVRVRITNLNPAKKDLPGEIFTVANRILGNVRKYVPYGEVTENGWYIPYIIYQQLKERQFLNTRVRKDARGREIIEQNMAREFALEIMPDLTGVELARLAAAQAAGNNID